MKAVAVVLGIIVGATVASARDGGQFSGSPLKAWFDHLASGKGLCCSLADGVAIEDVDWEMTGNADFPYLVNIDHHFIQVPAAAVVTEPNKFGQAVVWPYQDGEGKTQIRCFIPGAGA